MNLMWWFWANVGILQKSHSNTLFPRRKANLVTKPLHVIGQEVTSIMTQTWLHSAITKRPMVTSLVSWQLQILRWHTFMFRPPWQPPSPRGLPSAVLKGVECVGVGRAPICRQRLRSAYMGRRCAPTPTMLPPLATFRGKFLSCKQIRIRNQNNKDIIYISYCAHLGRRCAPPH